MAKTTAKWTDSLPMVLLGQRSSVKVDINCSSSELVYGTPLRFPGEFIVPTTNPLDPTSYADILKQRMQNLIAIPTHVNTTTPTFVSKELMSSSHVFNGT